MFEIKHGTINSSDQRQAILLCISVSSFSPQISKGYFYKCALVQPHSIWPLWHCQYSESQVRHGTEGLQLLEESEVLLATAKHHMNETKGQVHQESSFTQDNAVLSRLTQKKQSYSA